MYPFMTGVVAGAFVLSSLYHVFGIKQLRRLTYIVVMEIGGDASRTPHFIISRREKR
ncbi:MAG: hypothetical protein ACUVRT_06055 [Armatimonadota bacterium]